MTGFWLPLFVGLILIFGPLLWWAISRALVHRPAIEQLVWCQGCDRLITPAKMTWEMGGWYRCAKCHGHEKRVEKIGGSGCVSVWDLATETMKVLREVEKKMQEEERALRRTTARMELVARRRDSLCYETYIWQEQRPIRRDYV